MTPRNPWIGILWAVISTLILGMAGASIWLASFYYPRGDSPQPGPVDLFFQQLVSIMVLPGMLVGFAALAGLLFLHARRRARRHVLHRKAARES